MQKTTQELAYEDATPLLDDPQALREFGEREGYLFFKSRIPADALREVRKDILDVIGKHDLLKPGVDPDEARIDLDKVAQSEPFAGCTEGVFNDVQRLESFHRIAHHPAVLAIYERLFDGPVLPHPRNIARVLFPGPHANATPPHQDYIHIQGTQQTWTAWFPLGDCPRNLGGLSVLRRSHKEGVVAVGEAPGAGGLEAKLCPSETEWFVGDFEIGDVLTFPSTTIHKGMTNQFEDRIRLSCDFRYQSADNEIEEQSLHPHRQTLTWDEIYAGWKSKDLCYYWQKYDIPRSAWDESIRWQKERICN
ncbi:MAG: phytanoyl-CoA dioxygenase family protein [Planctomycetota bacterium]